MQCKISSDGCGSTIARLLLIRIKPSGLSFILMSTITVDRLTKIYPVAVKEAGFKGTVTHFFKR
ncbi:MAG: hypothetical protein C4287_09025, partial [Leptolyngbya sp. ERB_1_2]